MIGRHEFNVRTCVAALIHVVEQVPPRVADRGLLSIDDSTAGLLLLWSTLRWERTFAIRTLQQMGVDLWALMCHVDEALVQCRKRGAGRGSTSQSELDALLRTWLDRAAEQARALGHDFLGIEHLLLATLARDTSQCALVLGGCGVSYGGFKEAVVAALDRGEPRGQPVRFPVAVPQDDAESFVELEVIGAKPALAAMPAEAGDSTWIAELDRPAIGVPRRFGVFLMMLMVTLYAILFSVLQTMHATTPVFVFMSILFTGIGVGQAVLFGGRYPRSASIWTGSILVPIEILIFFCVPNKVAYIGDLSRGTAIGSAILILIAGVPLGAIFGYLFGTVTAGGFYLVDWYEQRHPRGDEPTAGGGPPPG